MPNWCTTFIKIVGSEQEELKDLYEKLQTWTSKHTLDNGFGDNWLGNVVECSGIDQWIDGVGFQRGIECRGYVSDLEFYDGEITICTDTAWAPMMEMWYLIADKYLTEDSYSIFYDAIEEGSGLYITNDSDIAGTFIVDLWLDDCEDEDICNAIKDNTPWKYDTYEWYVPAETIKISLGKLLNIKTDDIDVLLSELRRSEYGEFLHINMLEYESDGGKHI